jgi:hypothetical protein
MISALRNFDEFPVDPQVGSNDDIYNVHVRSMCVLVFK